ncbi:MAG: hydantoinase B/oxoprolinase family protein [Proteobacteria bacterium]|nr:hydantoinase B/oxoprolinase family protein [Pseudomonadota bacterium]
MSATDTFTLEIIKNALVAVGDEMFVAMQRTSMSPIIYETLDYSCGLTDPEGNLITQGNGTTVFLGQIDSLVREVLKKFGEKGDIHDGDIFISNDPYVGGGTHLSDPALVQPIFFEDELVAFVINKAHWTEVGGKDPGSFTTNATEIFQEGLQLPNIRIFSGGKPNAALIDLIAANVRLPEMSLGDMWAGVAANRVGERRVREIFAKYGVAEVKEAIVSLLDYGEEMIRQEMKNLPKGVFEAEDWIDDDGLGNGPFRIQVKVTITDDEFIADFTGSHAQVPGPINNSRTGLVSAVRTVFKALSNPSVPANGGCFRPMKVICPDGTMFTAKRPAPVSLYWETMMAGADLIWKALAPHIPERLTAGHMLSVCATIITGTHPDTGEFYLMVGPLVGGWGAGATKDGDGGQFASADGETFNIPVEIAETRYGVLVDQYAFHNDDGGFGKFRGGKGVVLDYRILSDTAVMTGSFGRNKFKPWGIGGGGEGSPNYAKVLRADGGEETYTMFHQIPLKKGDVVRLVTATGGGVGDPRERPRDKVRNDLRDGYVTIEQARVHYGYDAKVAAE